MFRSTFVRLRSLAVPIVLAAVSADGSAQDWTNSGGNAQRNGLTTAYGPLSPQALWSAGPQSLNAWRPVVAGDRVFVVRQTGGTSNTAPPQGAPNDTPGLAPNGKAHL